MHKNILTSEELKKKVNNKQINLYSSGGKVSYEEWVFDLGLDIEKLNFTQRVTHYKTFWKWVEKIAIKTLKKTIGKNHPITVQIFQEDFEALPKFLKFKLKNQNKNIL